MTELAAADRVSRARLARRAALGVPVAISSVLWLADAGYLALQQGVSRAVAEASVLTWPLVIGCGLTLGVIAMGLCALAWLGRQQAPLPLRARITAWLRDGDASTHAGRIAALIALLVVVAVLGYVGYLASYRAVLGMAQPDYIALAVVGVHLCLVPCGFWLWLPLRNGARFVIERMQNMSGAMAWLAWPVLRTWRAVSVMTAVALLLAVLVALRASFALSYFPWESIGKVALALSLGGLVRFAYARARPLLRRVVLVVLVLGTVTALLFAGAWGANANSGRVLAEEHTLSGAVGYRLLRALIDFDSDGHIHVLGGGDCAPRNAAIHPAATDLPDNRIDEDCDGEDLNARMIEGTGGYRFGVPKDWPEQPPIVLITVDAFAATRMAAFGNKNNVTPNIDRFAQGAALFRACFAQGPSTRLSVPALFTSRWDTQIEQRLEGKHPYPIADSELTLAEVLQKAGYDTVAVLPDGYFDPHRWKGITAGFRTVDTSAYRMRHEPHNATTVTDVALAMLAKPRAHPLFLWVHYYDAHSPHTQPEGTAKRGDSLSDIYDAELSHVDREVGRLISALDQGVAMTPPDPAHADEHADAHEQVAPEVSKPVIVLTADHGIDFNPIHHAKFNYGYDLYTSVLHVPLIVRVPGAAPSRHEKLASTMDVAPTIANLLRMKGRLPFQGVSLVRELASSFQTESRRLIHQFYIFENYWRDEDPLEKIALRTERFNLIHDRKRGAFELYDWRADYYEARDLVNDPAYAAQLKDLRKQLAFFTYTLHQRPAPVPSQNRPPPRVPPRPTPAVMPRPAPAPGMPRPPAAAAGLPQPAHPVGHR